MDGEWQQSLGQVVQSMLNDGMSYNGILDSFQAAFLGLVMASNNYNLAATARQLQTHRTIIARQWKRLTGNGSLSDQEATMPGSFPQEALRQATEVLQNLAMKEWFTMPEVERIYRVKYKTLHYWKSNHRGPRWIKHGRANLCHRDELIAFFGYAPLSHTVARKEAAGDECRD